MQKMLDSTQVTVRHGGYNGTHLQVVVPIWMHDYKTYIQCDDTICLSADHVFHDGNFYRPVFYIYDGGVEHWYA